jgi:hypothetical protein
MIENKLLSAFRTLVRIKFDLFFWLFILSNLSCIAKSTNFQHLFLQEKTRGFESTMNVLFLRKVEETRDKIFEINKSFRLCDCTSSGNAILKIPLIAKLSDDVAIIDSTIHVIAMNEVRMPKFL